MKFTFTLTFRMFVSALKPPLDPSSEIVNEWNVAFFVCPF